MWGQRLGKGIFEALRYLLFPWHACLWLGRYVNSKDLPMIYDGQIQILRHPAQICQHGPDITRTPRFTRQPGLGQSPEPAIWPESVTTVIFSQVQEDFSQLLRGFRGSSAPHIYHFLRFRPRERKLKESSASLIINQTRLLNTLTVTPRLSKTTQFPVQCPQIPSTDLLSLVLFLCE